MSEITWGGYMALPPSEHQHCTDEAQKAETVLSAVIYIYIYIYIYILVIYIVYILLLLSCIKTRIPKCNVFEHA